MRGGWLTGSLMEGIAAAFEAFLDRHGHFFRTRTRNNVAVARRYLRGLAQAEDCTFESMATVVEDGCPQQFQHFISNSPWDHEPVVAQIGQDADRLLGGKPTDALIIHESSFPKQGDRSVGVARQWTGRLGKADNCQVAVFGVLTDSEQPHNEARCPRMTVRLRGLLCRQRPKEGFAFTHATAISTDPESRPTIL